MDEWAEVVNDTNFRIQKSRMRDQIELGDRAVDHAKLAGVDTFIECVSRLRLVDLHKG